MGHTEFEVRIDRSPAVVWDYISDWRHDKDWQEGWLEVAVDPVGPLRQGTRKAKVRRTPLGVQRLTVEATRVDTAERDWNDVVIKGLAAGTTGYYQILPAGTGSRVRISIGAPRQGPARWLAPLIERSSGAVIRDGLERLRHILEGDGVDADRRSDDPVEAPTP